MDVTVLGTASPDGWPARGCGCASCCRLRKAGDGRAPTRIRVDSAFTLGYEAAPSGYRVRRLPEAGTETPNVFEVNGPDGARMLAAARPGALSARVLATASNRRYDLVLLDLVDAPWQLGELRRRGAVTATTEVIGIHVDHRVSSLTELERRFGFWGARLVPDGTTVNCASTTPTRRPHTPHRVLVLGGARSGKSEEAELRLAGEPAVTYVATGIDRGDDREWRDRIAAHRRRRPRSWHTVETTDLPGVLRSTGGAIVVDGLGGWLSAVLDEHGWDAGDAVRARTDELVAAWSQTGAYVVAVSDEVGGGVVPGAPIGRLFRDELGQLNRRIAEQSEEAVLVVAGRVVALAG